MLSNLKLVSLLDTLSSLLRKQLRASVLECIGYNRRSRVDQVLYRPSHLLALIRVLREKLVLVALREDLSQLHSGIGGVSTQDECRIRLQEIAYELKVLLSFLLIVVEGKQSQPVMDQILLQMRRAHHISRLILDDLANACNCVIASVLVLSLLHLLAFIFRSHVVLNRLLKRVKAHVRIDRECWAAVLGNYADPVTRSLS